MLDPAIRQLASVGRSFGTVCVVLPDEQIASHAMWVDAGDEHIIAQTDIHRAKIAALQSNPGVTATTRNPYSHAEVRGYIAATIGGPEARADIDALSRRYVGTGDGKPIQRDRVIVDVTPDRRRTYGL